MLDKNFMNDLDQVLSNGNVSGEKTPNIPEEYAGYDYSEQTRTNNSANDSNENGSEANGGGPSKDSDKDFFDKIPCDDVFCITFGAKVSSQNLLAGGKNNSIESILDKHIEKTEGISWSDLSSQKMNNNSFQLPFLNVNLSGKVAGGRVFIHNSPQSMKTLKTEDTPIKKEARFDQAYKCAMIDAGLSLDELKNAGVVGAGYILKSGHDATNISNAVSPVGPIDLENLRTENDCSTTYESVSRSNHATVLAGQLGEIQAFTVSILDVINQILETETKLDTVKVR